MRLFLIVIAACISTGAWAQKTDNFKRHLAQPDPVSGARVNIVEYDEAAQAVSIADNVRSSGNIKGYRVRIFFDNSQSARQRSGEMVRSFREEYPGISTYVTYESPNFKVTVGDCTSMEEAVKLWGRIKGRFDRAFIVSESIPISALTALTD